MSDAHVTAFIYAQAHWMNIIYAMTAACIIYKMAFIARQVPVRGSLAVKALRVTGAIVATIVAMKAFNRFEGGDAATWFDIIRELSWCGFLAAAIWVLKEKFGNW